MIKKFKNYSQRNSFSKPFLLAGEGEGGSLIFQKNDVESTSFIS